MNSLLYTSSLGQQGKGSAKKELAIKDDRKGLILIGNGYAGNKEQAKGLATGTTISLVFLRGFLVSGV